MTGLYLTPATNLDKETIFEILDQDYLLEWNEEFGCFFIEEDEDCYDALEEDIVSSIPVGVIFTIESI